MTTITPLARLSFSCINSSKSSLLITVQTPVIRYILYTWYCANSRIQVYIGCLCKLQATTHFLYSVCANSRPPLYLLACANSRLVPTYIYLSYLFPSPTTIIRQLPAFSPQHQVNTRPDPLQNLGLGLDPIENTVYFKAQVQKFWGFITARSYR